MIPSAAQEFMAAPMGATVRTIAASHASLVSQLRQVAEMILMAEEAVAEQHELQEAVATV